MNKRERYARCKAEGRCPNCFNKHDGEHLYCEKCLEWRDKKYSTRKPCIACGAELPRGSKLRFCKNCRDQRKTFNSWRDWYYSLPEDQQIKIKAYRAGLAKDWRSKNPEQHQDSQIKRRYGIGHGIAQMLYEKQNGKCAICHKELKPIASKAKMSEKAHIDHNHKTGEVRRLLCANCNHLIGNCMEDIHVLLEAIEYLKIYCP